MHHRMTGHVLHSESQISAHLPKKKNCEFSPKIFSIARVQKSMRSNACRFKLRVVQRLHINNQLRHKQTPVVAVSFSVTYLRSLSADHHKWRLGIIEAERMHFFFMPSPPPRSAEVSSPPVCKKCRLTADWLPRAPLPFADQSESVFLQEGAAQRPRPDSASTRASTRQM